jgi:ClpX C4-type zinc finger
MNLSGNPWTLDQRLINDVTAEVVTGQGIGLESKTKKLPVKLTSTKPQPSCSFCKKPRLNVGKLIESPNGRTHICDECTVRPDRLALLSEKSKIQSSFFNRIDCSFCRKKMRASRLYLSTGDTQSGSYICKSCLSACRQILADESRSSPLASPD